MKDIIKSKKFGLAFVGALKAILVAYFLRDNPELAFKISATVAGLFGMTAVGQAHADANQEDYGVKYKEKKKK